MGEKKKMDTKCKTVKHLYNNTHKYTDKTSRKPL